MVTSWLLPNWSVMARSSMVSTSWLSGSTRRMSRQMLSASCGSLSSRYRSALAMARGTAALVIGLSSNMARSLSGAAEGREQIAERIVPAIGDPVVERDDGVVGDVDLLRTDPRAALGDVAEPDPFRLRQFLQPVLGVERMHLQRRDVGEEARADELLLKMVLAQDVADVLAEEALDALAKLLHALDVRLVHAPGAVGRVGRTRFELLDPLLDREVPGDVGDQVLDGRERLHRRDRHRPLERKIAQPRHAHQTWKAVDLRRARAALARLAVPAHGQIPGLFRLDAVEGVEHRHALRHLGGVVAEGAAPCVAAPDGEGRLHLISSMICFSAAGLSGLGPR